MSTSSATNPVAVIGGGIVGSSIALHLADRDTATVLVDQDARPQGATRASFASISAFDEARRDTYLLKAGGMGEWRRWAKRLGRDVGLRFDGEIRWEHHSGRAKTLSDRVRLARSRGYPVALISERELKTRLADARPGPVAAASWAWEDGQVEPASALSAAQEALEVSGQRIIRGVRARLKVGEAALEVLVGDEVIEASTVVLAAGAETPKLTEALGLDVPLVSSPGLLAVTTPLPQVLRGVAYAPATPELPLHLRQRADGRVLIGEGSQQTIADKPTQEHAERLLRLAARYFPWLAEAKVEAVSLEWRPMPSDRLPIIGPVPGIPSLYVATMHSGVTLAPAVGDLVAQEIAVGGALTRLGPFRPARFARRHAEAVIEIENAFTGAGPEIYLG